jgi:hypothetical protein
MKVGIMQPYFFPYFGYFQLINEVDVYVNLDHVSFMKRSFMTRNKIKNETIPQVLIFELNDGIIEENDIKLLTMAPRLGLIYFKTKNGIEYWRENF